MFDELRGYWRAYGGIVALAKSPFLWVAILLTALTSPWWLHDEAWPETALLILPPLLGFTIGAMAVVLAFPTSKIFKYLAEDGRSDSYYAQLAAKLTHFVIIQVAGIIFAVLSKAHPGSLVKFFSIFLLFYATLTAVAIALSLFGMAQLYNDAANMNDE